MKTLIATSVLTALLASGVAVMAQGQSEDYLGLPGDNLNLYAVMTLFQESKTLEEFERVLNDESSKINNLDLNGDNLIDYISVFDNVKGNVHNIVLQVAVNRKERQDVAVFTVERDRRGNVMIQLTGDEELYGENYIIEPVYEDSVSGLTPNPGYTCNSVIINGRQVNVVTTTSFDVAYWPVISYIYNPGYVVWRSSWYWGYYPEYWHPWRPYYWHYYYGYHCNWYNHYYAYYRRWDHHRDNYWHDYYYHNHHEHSAYVSDNVREGHYKTTYSHPEQRKNGEELYTRNHSDHNIQRTKNVVDNHKDNGYVSAATGDRRSTGKAIEPSRNSERSASVRTLPKTNTESYNKYLRKSDPGYTARTETKTLSDRAYHNASSPETISSGRRSDETVANRRTRESSSPVYSRPTETKSRESTSRQPSPERKVAKPQESRSRENQSKSKVSETEKGSRRR